MKYLLSVLLILFFVAGCQSNSIQATTVSIEVPTVTPALPTESTGVIKGSLKSIPTDWSGREIYAFAAPVLGSEEDGVFVLDDTIHPRSSLQEDFSFQLAQVPAGKYVLVFGPSVEEALAYREGLKAIVFDVPANNVTDVGELLITH